MPKGTAGLFSMSRNLYRLAVVCVVALAGCGSRTSAGLDSGANDDGEFGQPGRLGGPCEERLEANGGVTLPCEPAHLLYCAVADDPRTSCKYGEPDAECICVERIADGDPCRTRQCRFAEDGTRLAVCLHVETENLCDGYNDDCICFALDDPAAGCPKNYGACEGQAVCESIIDNYDHCGTCGKQCFPGQACDGGACQ